MKYSEKQIEKLLKDIYSGEITEYALPDDLYFAISDYLKKAVFEGFHMTVDLAAGSDKVLLQSLVDNVYLFSGAKTFQEVKAMSAMVTAEGELRTYKEFAEIARKEYDLYNVAWANSEYNTAVGQADSAAKWNEIENNKDVLPMLRYSAVIDANTSDICEPLDGILAPVDDPIWDTITPLNHYNCRCVLLQEDSGERSPDADDRAGQVEDKMQDAFKNNVGKTGEVFTKDHPYFDVPKEDRDFAKTNFGLTIPE